MTEFERLAQSPEVLGAFLASLPVVEAPWDAEFQKRFCAYCPAKNCDNCQCDEFRNNPRWWLTLTDKQEVSEETKRTVVIDIESAEFERELSPEERAEMERLRPMFRYFMGKDLETGEIEIGSMDGENRIVFKGTEEASWFMENLKELIQEATIHG